ncbi:MAG: MFS transporter [Candidatus Moranbacteria bacterium]|nr:MFS transporter [Candidatus Moranbacteria bacterium]
MHNENLKKNKIRLISLLSFAIGFLDAFFIYVLSTYFSAVSGTNNVGVFYFLGYSIVLITLFYLQPLIRLMGKVRILYLCLGITICASAVLVSVTNPWVAMAMALVLIVSTNVTWVSLDILLESFSKDHYSGSIRGLYLTIMNLGLLAAPFLSLETLDRFNYEGIFLVLVFGYMIVFLVALLGFRTDNRVFQEKLRLSFTIKKMLGEKNLFRIYGVSFAMEFFYALMIIYTPLYLRSLEYSWSEIGTIFTIMLVPFVLLQYPLGILADHYFGEKEMLIVSIAIAALATLTLPFLGAGNIFAWALALFMTRVGIAGIEILRDSYFYKQIDGNDMDIIAFFRTTRPLANIFGATLSILVLLFLPLGSLFFFVAAVLFGSLVTAFYLNDTDSMRDRLKAVS